MIEHHNPSRMVFSVFLKYNFNVTTYLVLVGVFKYMNNIFIIPLYFQSFIIPLLQFALRKGLSGIQVEKSITCEFACLWIEMPLCLDSWALELNRRKFIVADVAIFGEKHTNQLEARFFYHFHFPSVLPSCHI